MAFRLQVKRGTVAPNSVLHVGELGFDTVAKKLYVGNGSGVAESGVSMDGHAHAASAITSGEFDIARIPTITVAKGGTNITSYTSGDIQPFCYLIYLRHIVALQEASASKTRQTSK